MKFIMKPKNTEAEVYLVKICYENGNAYRYTNQVVRLENYSKKEAQEYLIELQKVCTQISDFLIGKTSFLDENISKENYTLTLSTNRKVKLPVSRDLPDDIDLYSMETMWIENVTYIDEDGDAFEVIEWDV